MSMAGQITAWKRAMSLPTMCTLGPEATEGSSSSDPSEAEVLT